MNYWLDIRLKIINFFKKNKKKIIIIVIVWSIVIAINYYLKYRPKIYVPKTTYTPHNPVIDSTDSVPNKDRNSISELIDKYVEYCNNKDYENAFNLLSDEYKNEYKLNLDDFKEYIDSKFQTKKIYNIQNYSNLNKTYVYRIRLLDDILKTGTTDEYVYGEEKIVIKEENGSFKISLDGFCGIEEKNIDVEDDFMQIKIYKKYINYTYSTYELEIKNKTNNYIVLSDSSTIDSIQLKLPNDIRTAKYMEESNIAILPSETIQLKFTFDEYFDDKQDPTNFLINSIRVLPEYSGINENIEKENENAIKMYSLSIDLIAKTRN